MSILAAAKAEISNAPLIITLLGTPGSGKTMTACTFPKPFLIRTQGESVPRDLEKYGLDAPASLGVTETEAKLMEQLHALIRDEHDYKTLIIDSVTGLESMFINEVIADDPKAKNIQQAAGGYGAGRDTVAAKHSRVRKAAELLRTKRGMNVVFLAHSDINRVDPPDGESYTQFSLRLHGKSQSPYIDEVDVVGQIKQPTALVGEGRKRAIGQDERVLLCTMTPAAVTKNRLGISEEIEIEPGKNPLAKWVVGGRARKAQPKKGLLVIDSTGGTGDMGVNAAAILQEEGGEFSADDFVEEGVN